VVPTKHFLFFVQTVDSVSMVQNPQYDVLC
jgi:hypothetical protein